MKIENLGQWNANTQVIDANEIHNEFSKVENLLKTNNYTSFEVFPTTTDISGEQFGYDGETISSVTRYYDLSVDDYQETIENVVYYNKTLKSLFNWTDAQLSSMNFTSCYYIDSVSSCDTLHLQFFTSKRSQKDNDIIIDWGDGSENLVMKTHVFTNVDMEDIYKTNTVIYVNHKYLQPNMKYIVKIYGKDYMMVRSYVKNYENIVSRVFDHDLHIADNVENQSSMCNGSKRILKVQNTDGYDPLKNVVNYASVFLSCTNLQYVDISYFCVSRTTYSIENMFNGCTNLKTLNDFRLPSNTNDYVSSDYRAMQNVFNGCINLDAYVDDLLPLYGWSVYKLKCKLFTNCKKLKIKNYNTVGDILWNNTVTQFTETASCFTGCDSIDLSQIPTTWGGTGQNLIIDKIPQINGKITNISNGLEIVGKEINTLSSNISSLVNNDGYPLSDIVKVINIDGANLIRTKKSIKPDMVIVNSDIEPMMEIKMNITDSVKTIEISSSDQYQGNERVVMIDWGDGTEGEMFSDNVISTRSHTYEDTGIYTIRVQGFDDFNWNMRGSTKEGAYYSPFYNYRKNILAVALTCDVLPEHRTSQYQRFANMPNCISIDIEHYNTDRLNASFRNDTSLEYVRLPNTHIRYSDAYFFAGCEKLSTIEFLSSVEFAYIAFAFYDCTALSTIDLRKSGKSAISDTKTDISSFICGTALKDSLSIVVSPDCYDWYIDPTNRWSYYSKYIVSAELD